MYIVVLYIEVNVFIFFYKVLFLSIFFFFYYIVYYCYIGNFGKIEGKYLNLYFFLKYMEYKYISIFDKDFI